MNCLTVTRCSWLGPVWEATHQDRVRALIARWPGPVVADADALPSVVPRPDLVVTPHAGEFERMSGVKPSFATAATLAENLQGTVLLKGNPTFVASNSVPWLVDSGGPELATIGTGDVLAGMVAALLANGLSPERAALSAAFWHGRAGVDAGGAERRLPPPGFLRRSDAGDEKVLGRSRPRCHQRQHQSSRPPGRAEQGLCSSQGRWLRPRRRARGRSGPCGWSRMAGGGALGRGDPAS